jgi:hypothetical protein
MTIHRNAFDGCDPVSVEGRLGVGLLPIIARRHSLPLTVTGTERIAVAGLDTVIELGFHARAQVGQSAITDLDRARVAVPCRPMPSRAV